MDKYLQQTFDIRFLKIGAMVNAGVLQIGSGAGKVPRKTPIAYTTVGSSLVGISGPLQFSVPLQAAIRQK
ncbi:spore germination protein GerPB [Bacillus sp. USDA818B3_A]|uniref:spore germination protein GerPB n=1 Tax=Bacillus sp. USDA818B3_A TaxID=2698834 RepID=UPI00136AFC0A|nr:spore germination protein GerPB [Bacillus sp. USDA818B3_A]